MVTNDSATGFVAEVDDEAVGYVAVCVRTVPYRTKQYVEIENMGVMPAYRSKGIGRELVKVAQTWAKKQNADRMLVSAFSRNEKALQFYRSLGFHDFAIDLEMEV